MVDIGGIILAAGLSERMKSPTPKQLLPLGGATVAAAVVQNAEGSQLDRVVVVTGHRGGDVAAAVGGGRAEIVENPAYREGNMTSFRAGAVRLAGCEAYVVLLADMPGVSTEMTDRLVETWRVSHPWAAVSQYRDGLAHPLLLSEPAMGAAVQAEGAKGVWRFLAEAAPGTVQRIRFDMPMPLDINTLEDYSRARRPDA